MFIKEESLFNFLTWMCLSLSGLGLSATAGGNYFAPEQNTTVIIRSCCKMPKYVLMDDAAWAIHLAIIVLLTLHFFGFIIHAAIFLKQSQLEEEQSAGQWVTHYENGEIRFEMNDLSTVNRKLWKHDRNVVSALGSFLSFLISAVYRLICNFLFLIRGPEDLSIIRQLMFFSVHSLYFFGLNFIETVCSPTLRGTIFNVIPRVRQEDSPYRVVNV